MSYRQNFFARPLSWVATTAAIATTVAMVPVEAIAATISATASGSFSPGFGTFPDPLVNGDFTITPLSNAPRGRVGNGSDEITTWDFDFTNDPSFSSFSTSEDLTSALLTLTLRSGFDIASDTFKIVGLPDIEDIDVFQNLGRREVGTFTFDLLDYYTSNDIFDVFSGSTAGFIPMEYRDDAILSFAQLDLSIAEATSATVPEPTMTLGLLAIGVGGLFSKRLRQE
ncbi:PEP-CTERM sorting domain-containing protein [Oscillatoriales cyanobacterium LEGE 11467]|uniref:PEP-CTERM sorting domain-containing protein n=1 Tax=Zarconia navalis LEGE 11467 TaxID=1828826 RepID=A0A928W1C8_9CYAN|nr:PEP-CTERM sorting domain-containing protein [Zarconia navalis]MBE9042166.1 PEP-CTERM sorting domain-containing protein [Zarconia navalis LEGE 11467]